LIELYFNSAKQLLKDQNTDEENQQPVPSLTTDNELNTLNHTGEGLVSLEKFKLEVEQRVNIDFNQIKIRLFFVRNILKNFYDIVIGNFNK